MVDRNRAGLNLGDLGGFEPKKPSQLEKRPKEVSQEKAKTREVAAQEGFSARKPTTKIDGRTLRATGRSAQLNMAVKPDTKDMFWILAKKHGFANGEEFLLSLLDRFRD